MIERAPTVRPAWSEIADLALAQIIAVLCSSCQQRTVPQRTVPLTYGDKR